MCEISPKIQCSYFLTYCAKGMVYCRCGTCLESTDKTRKMNRDRFDTLSIPNYVIKKGPLHGARHGNTERQRIYHVAHVAAKKANDFNPSWIAIGWDEAFCANYDIISPEDHTCVYTAAEHRRLENSWIVQLNSQGRNGPVKLREGYAEAVRIEERLYKESGGYDRERESTVLKI